MAQQKSRYSESTENLETPADVAFALPASGSIIREDIPDIVTSHDDKVDKDWADGMAFMNQYITISIHESNDPEAEPRVPVWNNGDRAHPQFGNYLPRGVELKIQRRFAEVLLRAKPIGIKTVTIKDHTGADTAEIRKHKGNSYPFVVVNPTKADQAWMRRVSLEA